MAYSKSISCKHVEKKGHNQNRQLVLSTLSKMLKMWSKYYVGFFSDDYDDDDDD